MSAGAAIQRNADLCRPPAEVCVRAPSWAWFTSLPAEEQAWLFGALAADSERTERILIAFAAFQRERRTR
jgi:hypothetical protein